MHLTVEKGDFLSYIKTPTIWNTPDHSGHNYGSYLIVFLLWNNALLYFGPSLLIIIFSGVLFLYLSRTFKSYIGMKLIDYIHRTKLTAAKALLESTDYTVEKIAAAVGYQNVLTFNRAFKRYEAMTPGVYRSRSYQQELDSQ